MKSDLKYGGRTSGHNSSYEPVLGYDGPVYEYVVVDGVPHVGLDLASDERSGADAERVRAVRVRRFALPEYGPVRAEIAAVLELVHEEGVLDERHIVIGASEAFRKRLAPLVLRVHV